MIAGGESPLYSVHRLQCQSQGMCAEPAVALGLNGQVELVGEGESGQAEVHSFGFVESDAHVFDEVLDKKSRVKITVHDTWAEVVY